jgi:hypothetical protein
MKKNKELNKILRNSIYDDLLPNQKFMFYDKDLTVKITEEGMVTIKLIKDRDKEGTFTFKNTDELCYTQKF